MEWFGFYLYLQGMSLTKSINKPLFFTWLEKVESGREFWCFKDFRALLDHRSITIVRPPTTTAAWALLLDHHRQSSLGMLPTVTWPLLPNHLRRLLLSLDCCHGCRPINIVGPLPNHHYHITSPYRHFLATFVRPLLNCYHWSTAQSPSLICYSILIITLPPFRHLPTTIITPPSNHLCWTTTRPLSSVLRTTTFTGSPFDHHHRTTTMSPLPAHLHRTIAIADSLSDHHCKIVNRPLTLDPCSTSFIRQLFDHCILFIIWLPSPHHWSNILS